MIQYRSPVVRITALVVHQPARGRGISRMLIDHALRWAENTGCELVELTSALSRAEAHAFYRDLGFEANSLRFRKLIPPFPIGRLPRVSLAPFGNEGSPRREAAACCLRASPNANRACRPSRREPVRGRRPWELAALRLRLSPLAAHGPPAVLIGAAGGTPGPANGVLGAVG
jgi:predicted GNAT family acetyltransferase